MPNHNMTYEDYLQMFGTKKQLDEYRIKQSELREWIEENIPVYKPQNRFLIAQMGGLYDPENDTLYVD